MALVVYSAEDIVAAMAIAIIFAARAVARVTVRSRGTKVAASFADAVTFVPVAATLGGDSAAFILDAAGAHAVVAGAAGLIIFRNSI